MAARKGEPATYTNRKGQTYYLCQILTKSGKPRHVFAREPVGTLLSTIPAGFEIIESVNGVVSLRRVTASPIAESETAQLRATIGAHPRLAS